jgi:hypothetical protein
LFEDKAIKNSFLRKSIDSSKKLIYGKNKFSRNKIKAQHINMDWQTLKNQAL